MKSGDTNIKIATIRKNKTMDGRWARILDLILKCESITKNQKMLLNEIIKVYGVTARIARKYTKIRNLVYKEIISH